MNNNSCNCLMGFFHNHEENDESDELTLNNYVDKCVEYANFGNYFNDLVGFKYKKIHPKDYLEHRRNMTTLYEYCPKCGHEIDFKELKLKLKLKLK